MPDKSAKTCSKPHRIVIIGTSCSGKTTLARQISQQLAIKHIELDELHWLPGWKERKAAEFRQLVAEAIAGDNWVVDGNYSCVRGMLWPCATIRSGGLRQQTRDKAVFTSFEYEVTNR